MIKTFLVLFYVIGVMVFLVPLGLIPAIFYYLGFRKSMAMVIYRFAQFWGWSSIKLSGSKVTVIGKENIPKKGSVCFVSNHCGYLDILLLLGYADRQFGFVAKKELLFVPFLNFWIHILGGLFIDRKNVRKAIRTINKGIERIKSGNGILIFPEGTRSKGRGLLPFHPGSLKLATSAQSLIVPVAIHGSYDVLEKTGRVVSSNVTLTFMPAINTAELPPEDRKQVLCDRIFEAIKEKLPGNNE